MSLATDLTAISANNKAIIDNSNKAVELNNKLEQTLYGTDTGGKSYYDEFWDNYQDNGNRTSYNGLFAGQAWTNDTANPKYDITPSSFLYGMWNCGIKRLTKKLGKNGVTVDFSKCYQFSYAFSYSIVEYIEEMDITAKNNTVILTTSMFNECRNLATIGKLICRDIFKYQSTMFANCTALENITIDGCIGGSISFQWSPLTAESAISIITHLKDYKGTDSEFANTLTLSSTTLDFLDAEGETSPNGNTWRLYMTDLGWILN